MIASYRNPTGRADALGAFCPAVFGPQADKRLAQRPCYKDNMQEGEIYGEACFGIYQ